METPIDFAAEERKAHAELEAAIRKRELAGRAYEQAFNAEDLARAKWSAAMKRAASTRPKVSVIAPR